MNTLLNLKTTKHTSQIPDNVEDDGIKEMAFKDSDKKRKFYSKAIDFDEDELEEEKHGTSKCVLINPTYHLFRKLRYQS